jgi:2-polyprenyl-3-methyl-5-hydroxy-6-metoxy-1,4-benzoquinol methylase
MKLRDTYITTDYGKVDPQYHGARALTAGTEMARHLAGCEQLRILDFGSGSGAFAEEMRRRGFQHVESYDPFSSPVEPLGSFRFNHLLRGYRAFAKAT